MFEFKNYFIIKTKSELIIDNSKSSSSLRINVDLTLHRIPCHILNMDISDFTGAHTSNVKGTLVKRSLDKDGNVIKTASGDVAHKTEENVTPDEILKAFNESQGCRFTGSFDVMRLPGNFHIASHTFVPILREFREQGKNIHINLTHTIHHISFEDEKDLAMIRKTFDEGIMTPMDGFYNEDDNTGTLLNYYINIIPTEYIDIDNNKYQAFQFTYKQKKVDSGRMIPTIFFKFHISPMKMRYTKYFQGHFDGLINICAIFGGMFTIAGILNSILLKIFKTKNEVKGPV